MKLTLKNFFFALTLLIPVLVHSQTYVVIDTELKTCKTKVGSANSEGEIIDPRQTDNLFKEKVSAQRTDYWGNATWSGTCSLIEISDYSLYLNANNVQWGMTLYIPKTIEKIGINPFQNFSRHYTKISISDLEAWCRIQLADDSSNPCSISGNLYLNEELIENLEIPESITTLKPYAFSYCSSIKSIKFPENIIGLGKGAFYENTSLTNVTIPNTVTEIGNSVFESCKNLEEAILPENENVSYGTSIFARSGISKIKIPSNMKIIPEETFIYCQQLTQIDIPEGVTSIGNKAFESSGLNSITLPTSVTTIGRRAFADCDNLKEVNIGNGVKEIELYAFYSCPSLTNVCIGKSVNTIKENAFNNANLRIVTSLNPAPPTITATTFNSETTDKGILLVPEASIQLYRLSPYWTDFTRIEAIPNSGSGGSNDQNGESIFNVKIDKYIYMSIDEEQNYTTYLPTGVSASSWESTDDDIVEVTKRGKAEAYEYGNVIVKALDSNDETVLTLGVFVCPTVKIHYGAEKTYEHHVIYNSTPTVYIAAPENYEIVSITHDGVDITEEVLNNDGNYQPNSPVTDNSVINVTLESTLDAADLNGDGIIDVSDLNWLLERMMNQ